jgi:uncharacterized protein (DUF1499 family)
MFSGTPPSDLGVHDGRLKPCPARPNCVSSQERGRAAIAPLTFGDSPAAAWSRLETIVRTLPRVHIVAAWAGYLRAEAASRVFGFVDDLEFHLDAARGVVHARSAARLGRHDFGVNRRRIEAIRARFSQPARVG